MNENALAPAPVPQQQMPQQSAGPAAAGAPQNAPQLSHQQTVAILRHLTASARELEVFLKDPALGKSNMRGKIIDGTTNLVSQNMLTAPQAVDLLATVPDDPLQQRQWVQQHFINAMLSMNAALDHHAASNPGTGDATVEIAKSTSKPDDHLHHIGTVVTNYKQAQRAPRRG